MQATSAPAITATAALAAAGAVVIVDDELGVGEALAERARRPRRDGPAHRAGRAAARRRAGGAARRAHARARRRQGARAPRGARRAGARVRRARPRCCCSPRRCAPTCRRRPRRAAPRSSARARLGGAFGLDGEPPRRRARRPARSTASSRRVAHEWPDGAGQGRRPRRTRPPRELAAQLLAELYAADGLVEVGYRDGAAHCADAGAGPARRPPRRRRCSTSECVVLVTGGARGITARVALTLGRAPPPDAGARRAHAARGRGARETARLTELADLRRALIERRRREQQELTPALVERDCQRILERARGAREPRAPARDRRARRVPAAATSPTRRVRRADRLRLRAPRTHRRRGPRRRA